MSRRITLEPSGPPMTDQISTRREALPPDPRRPWPSAAVHAFTASGVVCALFAVEAALAHRFEAVFAWLGLSLVIDAVDGMFARRVEVKRNLPRFSGEQLDLVVDYVTYVFVPVMVMRQAGLLPGWLGFATAALVLLSSLFHFSDTESKAADHSFVGFPALWNIVAFYAFAFGFGSAATLAVALVCIVATFVPLHWLHPMRTPNRMAIAITGTIGWSAAATVLIWSGFGNSGWAATAARTVLVALATITLVQVSVDFLMRRRDA